MAKSVINIQCPSGHRRKAQVLPNSNLLQVLEDVCKEENLDPSQWGLTHLRQKCDLSIPWRLQNIPTNAVLDMYQLEDRRSTDDINVQLQLPDNSKYSSWFEPTVTLQEMLDWYRIQEDSMVAALDISLSGNHNSCPTCSYMREEIIGEYALSNTTLRELGLTSGTAVIRYNLRPITDDELQKINGRVDDKIVRRRQQQHEQEQKSKQTTTNPTPVRSSPSSNSTRPPPTTSTASSSKNEEYSIFRDPPASVSRSRTSETQKEQQSKTLAEELGINFSLDPEPKVPPSQTELRNFKFPASTRGKDLHHDEADEEYRRTQNVKPCDRRLIAYDLAVKTRPVRGNREKNSEELPDSFYELTADDLRSLLHTFQQESSSENPLETRAMRERAQSARHMTYEQIAIRFVVNSRSVLQGFFRPEEPVSRLREFTRTNLICSQIKNNDFYLYTSPPRVVLADERKPLSTYDLAPAAFVYLGHETVSPLNVQLASNIPVRTIDEANQLTAQYVFSRSRPKNEREYAHEREQSTLSNDRPASSTISLANRPTTRNSTASRMDDKQLRDKLRKFLPGKK